jgi:hypothetical protein
MNGSARDHQGGRGGDHGDDVGIVLEVMRQDGRHDLDFVLEALHEQRADRTVDQAAGEGFLLRRRAFAAGEAAGDLARGVELLLVIHRQGEEVLTRLRGLGEHRRGEDHGLAVRGEDGAVGLTGHAAGFEREGLASPLERLSFDIEHFGFFLIPRGVFPAGADRASDFRKPLQSNRRGEDFGWNPHG